MAAKPIIQSTGATSGAGTAGEGRNDLVPGEVVTLSDTEAANSGASYLWKLVEKPEGSTATLSSTTSATPTFTVDTPRKPGSFIVLCTVDGAYRDHIIIAVPLAITGGRIPARQEEQGFYEYNEAGNVRQWAPAMTDLLVKLDAGSPGYGEANAGMTLAYEDHFEDTALGAGWTAQMITGATGSISAGTPDIMVPRSGNDSLYALHSNWRDSHLVVQPEPGDWVLFSRAYTLPTNCVIWAAAKATARIGTTVTASEIYAALWLTENAADAGDDYFNVNIIAPNATTNLRQAVDWRVNGGTATSKVGVGDISTGHGCMGGIIKKGTDFKAFWGNPFGNWLYSDTLVNPVWGTTPQYLHLANHAAGGDNLIAWDFIKIYEGTGFLPF